MSAANNPIAHRLADFLAGHLPYSYLSEAERLQLTRSACLLHLPKDAIIFRAGQAHTGYVYVVYKGMVRLLLPNHTDEPFDTAGVGDTFGIRAVLSGNPYVLTAVCACETLLIALQLSDFQPLLQHDARFSAYFAAGLASGMLPRYQSFGQLWADSLPNLLDEPLLATVSIQREVVKVPPETSLRELARRMLSESVGSLLVMDASGRLCGIVTDKDLRRALANEQYPLRCRASDIMSSPVICVSERSSWLEAYEQMTNHTIRHLVVTQDGSPASSIRAVISERDLLSSTSLSLVSLLRRLASCRSATQLALLRQDAETRLQQLIHIHVPIRMLKQLAARINRLTVEAALHIAQAQMPALPSSGWCWIALGSLARHEQILRTDQDNALLLSNELSQKREYFLDFAHRVNAILEQCGYALCPAEVMASNPMWCLPLHAWQEQFEAWVNAPEPKAVMLSTIFFDRLLLFGEASVYKQLTTYCWQILERQPRFLSFLASNLMASPPAFNWLGALATETEGPHKNHFDLKARALAPYADVARLLALQHSCEETSTIDRFEQVATKEAHYSTLLKDAANAYEYLLRLRMVAAIRQSGSGRWIRLSDLSPLERQILKKALIPLRELQRMLAVRFQTHWFQR